MLFLLFVTVTVPLRACFDVDVPLWSVGFLIDLAVDIFFIVDVFLNFRTAFYDKHGFREIRPRKIAGNYLRGWFIIDFVSCLPVGYVQYFLQSDEDQEGADLRVVKVLRLMRMSKMMRLARIRRILSKYSQNVNLQHYLKIAFTVFLIMFLAHMLACFYFLVGTGDETLGNDRYISGWVSMEEAWTEPAPAPAITVSSSNSANATAGGGGQLSGELSDLITLHTKYWSSLYYVLNALENGYTTSERAFGACGFSRRHRSIVLGSWLASPPHHISCIHMHTRCILVRLRPHAANACWCWAHRARRAAPRIIIAGVFAELVRDIILGLVASLITTISMSVSTQDNETSNKLARLKMWLGAKKLPSGFQQRAMAHFNEVWTNQVGIDIEEVRRDTHTHTHAQCRLACHRRRRRRRTCRVSVLRFAAAPAASWPCPPPSSTVVAAASPLPTAVTDAPERGATATSPTAAPPGIRPETAVETNHPGGGHITEEERSPLRQQRQPTAASPRLLETPAQAPSGRSNTAAAAGRHDCNKSASVVPATPPLSS
eukprot:COSAG01_NODE_9431_length_2448_cov_1.225202_3_plen_543_part_01